MPERTKAVSRIYENIKTSTVQSNRDDIAKLIDNLYKNKTKFENIR